MKTCGRDLMIRRRLNRILRKAEKGNLHLQRILEFAYQICKILPAAKLMEYRKESQADLAT